MRAILLQKTGTSRETEVPFPAPPKYIERRASRRIKRETVRNPNGLMDVRLIKQEDHIYYELAGGTFAPMRDTDLAVYQEVGRSVANAAA